MSGQESSDSALGTENLVSELCRFRRNSAVSRSTSLEACLRISLRRIQGNGFNISHRLLEEVIRLLELCLKRGYSSLKKPGSTRSILTPCSPSVFEELSDTLGETHGIETVPRVRVCEAIDYRRPPQSSGVPGQLRSDQHYSGNLSKRIPLTGESSAWSSSYPEISLETYAVWCLHNSSCRTIFP